MTWTYYRPIPVLVCERSAEGDDLFHIRIVEHGQLLDATPRHHDRTEAERAGRRLLEQWHRTRRWTPTSQPERHVPMQKEKATAARPSTA